MTNENKEKIEEIIETITDFYNEKLGDNIDNIRNSFRSNTEEEEQALFDAQFKLEYIDESLGDVVTILKELIK